MRAVVSDYELVSASNLNVALELMALGFQPMAGGTDIMVQFNAGKLAHRSFVAIRRLAELNQISETPDFVEIGAAVTYSMIRQHAVLREEFPLLVQAACWTGGIANQNRGTLGGNIANASPAADSSPVLLVYEAELKLLSLAGERWVSYSAFHLGYKSMALRKDELIATIRLPRQTRGMVQYGRKVGARNAQAISKVSFAATARDGVFRIALGSVAPVPIRCLRTEAFLASGLIEEARAALREEISPITDIRSTSAYRAVVAENLLGEFLERLLV